MTKSITKPAAVRVAIINGQPIVNSRNIANVFGKRHDNVIKSIRSLECSKDFHLLNFEEMIYPVEVGKGATVTHTEYNITRDGFAFLCMGFTGAKAAAWKERYINTFNKMAEKLAAKAAPRVSAKVSTPPPAPTQPALTLRGRRWLVSVDSTGAETITPVADSACVVNPHNSDELAAFLLDNIPQHLLGEALATLSGRTLRLLNIHQRKQDKPPLKKIAP